MQSRPRVLQPPATQANEEPRVPCRDLRFLVVDDHEFQRSALLRLLDGLGVRHPLQADDGRTALELFLRGDEPVDIIISDLNMPGMDGIEFIRHVGQSGRQVAIVLASAMDSAVMASVEAMASAYGVTLLGVLEKPVTRSKIEAVLARYWDVRPAASAAAATPVSHPVDDIRAGLERGEFRPYFQPKVEMASGRVDGFEALVRWCPPGAPIILPGAFIGTMEQQGLIDALTLEMLKRSAGCCSGWRKGGLDLCVSVNLSVRSLADARFADRLVAALDGQDLAPRHIVFEITESAAIRGNVGAVLDNLSRLRMRGFGLSIDDFGTGYSSMEQLQRIAFTELKIDQSFVQGATRHPASMVILQSSLDIAGRLRLRTVAEGIETREQWDLLRGLGCDLAQGYFTAAPMAPEAVPGWVRDWQPPAPASPRSS